MRPQAVIVVFFFVVCVSACPVFAAVADFEEIVLPAPQAEGGVPLMQALQDRRSVRAFSYKELPLQVLGDLLWAAAGINRPESGKRTAPSARNMQEIDVYVARPGGLYLYDAGSHRLVPVLARDIRPLTGRQGFAKAAPAVLIYVADHRKMSGTTGEEKEFYGAVDTGFISQNVYLYCASQGLATVVLASFGKIDLIKAMDLNPAQRIILTQPVGYPE